VLLDVPGLRVVDVGCGGPGGRWSAVEPVTGAGLVLVRRGVFRRLADGVPSVLDLTLAYLQRPGQEQRIAHPAGADACTSIGLDPAYADRFGAGGPFPMAGAADLTHRRLVARAGGGADAVELADLATELLVAAAATASGRDVDPPGITTRVRRLVDDARARLAAEPALPLDTLAVAVGVSPWYLSRIFHAATGTTVSLHRRRLRTRAALDAILDRTHGLADIAARAGFADQAHLTRSLRAETGVTPGAVRAMLR
jgi:AraC-like DNA-binding protein